MPFAEFYIRSGGSNLNAGSTNTDSATVTSTNGGWSTVTNIFTAASGTPFSGVSVGEWASIATDAASSATFHGRITSVNSGGASITLSATARSGTAPTTAASGMSCRVGGAWADLNGPGAYIAGTSTNSSGHYPRVNWTGTLTVAAAQTISTIGPVFWSGYGSTPGDEVLSTLDGGTSGTSYVLLTVSGQQHFFENIVFKNNGATGSSALVTISGSTGRNMLRRCSASASRGHGFRCTNGVTVFIECEAYGCNQSNTATTGGFRFEVATTAVRCIAYGQTTANSSGFSVAAQAITLRDCIIAGNTGSSGAGIAISSVATILLENCTFYANRVGVLNNSGNFFAQLYGNNCHFEGNTTSCVDATHTIFNGVLTNCSFFNNGAKITANANKVVEVGSINLSSSGMLDPANGNFTPTRLEMLNSGVGSFLETGSTYSAITPSYPAIGAIQPARSSRLVVVP